jgi:hypothetical protein
LWLGFLHSPWLILGHFINTGLQPYSWQAAIQSPTIAEISFLDKKVQQSNQSPMRLW